MVYIVLVNWNRWINTIECLESVFRLSYKAYKVIVCDNCSSDGSLEHIRSWAKGELVFSEGSPGMRRWTTPPVAKPIHTIEVQEDNLFSCSSIHDADLLLVRIDKNLGFAGANNIALRYALFQDDYECVWLLNNDTVVTPNSLEFLLNCVRQTPNAGICGSTLLYYDDPTRVQACGGVFNHWLARGGHIGANAHRDSLPSRKFVEHQISFVVGASMLITRAFLQDVGLMNEIYFLYFEEVDWAVRCGNQFRLIYCPESIVFHKEGASTGGTSRSLSQSGLAEFYSTRSRIIFTRLHFPRALVPVVLTSLASAVYRLCKGNWRNCCAKIHGLFSGLFTSPVSIQAPGKARTRSIM